MRTTLHIHHLTIPIIAFSGVLFLASCGMTAPGKLTTPSGRPEIMVPHTNIQTVMDGVASWLAAQGRPILEPGMYSISTTLVKTSPGLLAEKTYYTSVYTIVQNGENVELYEETGGLTGQADYEDMQKELTQIVEFIKTRSSPEVTK